jgi:hypothetical protein
VTPRAHGLTPRAVCKSRFAALVCSGVTAAQLNRAFQRGHRPRLILAAMARLMVVLFSMQFSGTLHDATDLADVVLCVDEPEHEQCPPDRPCDDCPPGCPNCHCAAAGGTLTIAAPLTLQPQPLSSSLPLSLHPTQAPSGPELPSLFKPPRA